MSKGEEGKERERNERNMTTIHDLGFAFGLPERERLPDSHLTDSSIAQSQHSTWFKASRDFFSLLSEGSTCVDYIYEFL